jgi:hypothetical protein
MYTGKMINELVLRAEQVGRRVEEQRLAEERELHEIFTMQILVDGGERYVGAA